MSIREDRREAAIERMADHLLAEGLGAATLRPLAAAAGTSDRMLLYYFTDKDERHRHLLARIAARMIVQLDSAIRGSGPGLSPSCWNRSGPRWPPKACSRSCLYGST